MFHQCFPVQIRIEAHWPIGACRGVRIGGTDMTGDNGSIPLRRRTRITEHIRPTHISHIYGQVARPSANSALQGASRLSRPSANALLADGRAATPKQDISSTLQGASRRRRMRVGPNGITPRRIFLGGDFVDPLPPRGHPWHPLGRAFDVWEPSNRPDYLGVPFVTGPSLPSGNGAVG